MENYWHKQKALDLCILGFKGSKHEPWFWRSFPTQWACTSYTWSCAAPVNGLINGLLELFTPINGATLPETNLAPENGPSQKESSLPTASFRGYVSFREGISPLDTFTWFLCPSPIIFTWVGQTSLTSKSSSALRRTVQAWKGFAMPTRDHHQDYPPSGNGSDYHIPPNWKLGKSSTSWLPQKCQLVICYT